VADELPVPVEAIAVTVQKSVVSEHVKTAITLSQPQLVSPVLRISLVRC